MERAELRSVLRATGCAVEQGEFVFLCDPHASATDRAEMARQMNGEAAKNVDASSGWLCVRTGGSAGIVRFARHDEATLQAAVTGYCAHFDVTRVNAIDVLPAHHVSGLMARVRCAATGGRHLACDWQRIGQGDTPVLPGDDWVISLVPTQLQRLLRTAPLVDWLRRFRMILLGGGPLWGGLAEAAATARLPVAPSYGMTETAAMIAALRPDEFLAGARSSGRVMPHARIAIDAEGVLTIAGESLFRGYWPGRRESPAFTTQDLARLDDDGQLHLLGRRDAMIITGGRKVNPMEVETILRASGEFEDIAVIGVPDGEWGERVVACYPAGGARTPEWARAVTGLAPHQRPKQFVAIEDWPRNRQGKVNRVALRERVLAGSA